MFYEFSVKTAVAVVNGCNDFPISESNTEKEVRFYGT